VLGWSATFEPWKEQRLVLDSLRSIDLDVDRALDFVSA